MKNKKGVSFGMMVTIISMLAVFVILIVIVTKGLTTQEMTGKESVCQLSAWANCMSNAGTLGMSSFGLKCPTNLRTITMAELEQGKELAKKEMAAIVADSKIKDKFLGKNRYVTTSPSDDLALEFVLNKLVAKGMKTCWDNFKGVPCLFSRWWLPFGCSTNEKNCKGIIDKLKFWKSSKVPSYCVICERIRFDDEIKEKFTRAPDLADWMKVNEVSTGSGITYAQYLEDDVGSLESYSVSVHSEALAIVFGKVNKDFFTSYFRYIPVLFGGDEVLKDTRSLILIDYNNVNSYCMYIEGG